MKTRKTARTPDLGIPAPMNDDRIVLTGLVHMEAGKSLGRELAFCTADQNGGAFFLGPGCREGSVVPCPHCGGDGVSLMHTVVGLRRALFEGRVDVSEGALCLPVRSLLRNLAEAHGMGAVANLATARRAAKS